MEMELILELAMAMAMEMEMEMEMVIRLLGDQMPRAFQFPLTRIANCLHIVLIHTQRHVYIPLYTHTYIQSEQESNSGKCSTRSYPKVCFEMTR